MAGNVQHLAPTQKDYQLLSYLGRLNLTFLDKYLITASLRADGSSKFGKGNRWGISLQPLLHGVWNKKNS